MESKMKTFSVDGQNMRYLDIGQGPVLIFGHSYLWDSGMWAPQVEHLSQRYRCIVPDLWAHGESDIAPSSCRNLTDYATQVLSLLDSLEVSEFSIVGLSVGGMWGSELAVQAPQRVKSLVLMDTFVGLEPQVTHAKYFAMLDAVKAAQAIPQELSKAIVPLFFAEDTLNTDSELVKNFEQSLGDIQGERAVGIADVGRMVFGRRDLIEEVEKFALPVLIAVGQQDKARTPLESYLMHDCITGSELVEIPSAGHISNLEQPDVVNEMLERFLERVYQ